MTKNRGMERALPVLLALTLASGAGAPASSTGDKADLVLRRGVLYPVVPEARLEGSLAIANGRVVAVGSDADVSSLIGPDTRVEDLDGRMVVPGLIDAHSHLMGLGASLDGVDLRGAAPFAEVVHRVAAKAGEVPAGAWIRGRGWDQNLWPDKAFPTHDALSRAVPDHPVWLDRVDGHASLLNAAAMRALGVDASVPDPPGGRILRDENGEPTGVLVDNAEGLFAAKIPDPPAESLARWIQRGAGHALARGLTTVTEMGADPPAVAAYRALAARGELPIQTAVFWSGSLDDLATHLAAGPDTDPGDLLIVRGVKLYADGALGSRGAALLAPYDDDAGNLGLLVTAPDELRRVAQISLEHGFQVGIHAIGDRGNVIALDALQAVLGEDGAACRCRIEHAQIIRRQDLDRMAETGVIASMQPTHATSDMPWVPDRIGESRLERAYPWRLALERGVRLALGSDFPVEKVDPLLGIHAAVTRQDLAGNPEDGWLPDQVLTRQEALRGFTLDAAYSLFLDGEVGSLEPGKRADVVVFDRDWMAGPAMEIPDARVDLTLIGGTIVYRREDSQ